MIGEQKDLVRELEKDNGILLDLEKQLKREEKEEVGIWKFKKTKC